MKQLLLMAAMVTIPLSHGSELVCIAQKKIDSTIGISAKKFKIACNDGTETLTKRELRFLYFIPAGNAEKVLEKYMQKKELSEVATIKLSNRGPMTISMQDYPIRVFADSAEESAQWGFARIKNTAVFGPEQTKTYSFDIVLREDEGVTRELKNYSLSQLNSEFESEGFYPVFDTDFDEFSFYRVFLFKR
jgi:hypothetical protein